MKAAVEPRRLPRVPEETFEQALDEIADTIRRLRVPGRRRDEWIPWTRLSNGLRQEWREEAMQVMFATTQLLYGDNIRLFRK